MVKILRLALIFLSIFFISSSLTTTKVTKKSSKTFKNTSQSPKPPSPPNITIICDYSTSTYDNQTFHCFAKNVNITRKETKIVKITQLNNSTSQNFSTSKVTLFSVNSQVVKYFSDGIEKFFKNLQTLTIRNCGLIKITQNDLKGFKELKFLQLARNKISIIEKNLLKFNTKLELIDLYENKLKKIDGNVFDGLLGLRTLFMVGNECISREALDDRNEVMKIVEEIKEKCG